MKKLTLLVFVFFVATSASAQIRWGKTDPDVVVIGNNNPNVEKHATQQAIKHYKQTQDSGFKQSGLPRFVITSKNNDFLFGIGGFVNFRTAYDFDGIVDNLDFITYNIPVPGNYATREQLFMDASTSRLFFKAIANTKALGQVVSYIETDFRGDNGTLRLRLAYITFKGFLFGRNVTTFCDLGAGPNTIDFQGPNSYNFNYNQMIRYTRMFNKNRWQIGAAIEMPQLSATPTQTLKTIPQRIPDFIAYAQYNFDRKRSSHIRASGVLRDLHYYSMPNDDNESALGWGAQLSANIKFSRKFTMFSQAVYGRGITPYIQDITGVGMDLVDNPLNQSKLQTLPMGGWFAALQYNFASKWFCSGGYGATYVESQNNYSVTVPTDYKNAQYIFGNVFYNINSSCQVAVEYLYGTRENMDNKTNHANRVQAMIQYNF